MDWKPLEGRCPKEIPYRGGIRLENCDHRGNLSAHRESTTDRNRRSRGVDGVWKVGIRLRHLARCVLCKQHLADFGGLEDNS